MTNTRANHAKGIIALVPRRPRAADVTEDQLHSIAAAATRLGIHRATLYRMLKSGLLRSTRVGVSGQGLRISEREIRRYIREQEGR